MSKLEQNSTSLDEVLAMVNALPDAGGGGGGASVETCTVVITVKGTSMNGVAATVFDSDFGYVTDRAQQTQKYLYNVICGTVITVAFSIAFFYNNGLNYWDTGGGCVYDSCSNDFRVGYFVAPETAGATGTINIKYD